MYGKNTMQKHKMIPGTMMKKVGRRYVIALVGGTGKEGKGLAYRWSLAGHEVLIGSRDEEKAQEAARTINQLAFNKKPVIGMDNISAVKEAEVVVFTVPYSAHRDICIALKPFLGDKFIIDVTVPLIPPKVTKVQMPSAGSAAMEALSILGMEKNLGSAFHNLSHEKLLDPGDPDCEVLVCGTNVETREVILNLVADAGLTGWDAGPIENSVIPEGLTSILIGINKQFGIHNAGIKITGVDRN